MKTIIATTRSLRDYLNETINDTLHKNALDEEEKQEAQVSSSELFGDEGDTTKSAPKDTTKTPDATKEQPTTGDEKLKTGDISSEDIVTVLNAIRGGKSFNRDEVVAANLDKYVNDLSKAEKTSLLAFLKGISQIVTGVMDAQTAVEPADAPSDVAMTKKNVDDKQSTGTTKHVQPNVTKSNASQPAPSKQSGVENTAAPKKVAPITPKTR